MAKTSSALVLHCASTRIICPSVSVNRVTASLDDGVLRLDRASDRGERIRVVANLTASSRALPKVESSWRLLLDSDDVRFAGSGSARPLAAYQVLVFETAG